MSALAKMDLLVLQPTPFCNLDCTYCYLPNRSDKSRMTAATLDAIGRTIVASPCFNSDTTLLWHAGEPLALSPDWYRDACARLEQQSQCQISRQSFQTNATLITEDWLTYLAAPGVSVGVSIDGPEDINDAWRIDRSGRGTFARTMAGIQALNDAGVPFHVIAVITSAALQHPERIAETLGSIGAYSVGLNIEEVDGCNSASSLAVDHEGRFRDFLVRFAKRLSQVDANVRFRELDRLLNIAAAKRQNARLRHQENTPGAIISVSTTGDISSFSPEMIGMPAPSYNDFVFGNVHDITEASEIFLSRAFLRCQADISRGVSNCRKSCAYFRCCGGGSPSNKWGEAGTLDATETMQCRLTIKATFDALLDHLEEQSPAATREARHAS